MCGLAAAFAYRPDAPSVPEAWLGRTLPALAPRGPDGEGQWTSPDGRVALGHRRLAVLDPTPAGAQPMTDGRRTVVFNGEVYNFRALRADLERAGHRFRTETDTEVLLALYAAHGPAMARRLRGMFALALWDDDRRGLLLARDGFGVKPLYLADDGRTLRVASTVQALLAGGGVDTAPDPAGHVGFFLWGHVPDPHTLYRGVRALPAGTTLWVDARGVRDAVPFYPLPDALAEAEGGAPAGPVDVAAAAEVVRDALLDSVRHHLVSDVPVGAFLSAGKDSATLAALAIEAGGRLRTVTLAFDAYRGTPDDEAPLAEAVARHVGADHTTVRVGSSDFAGAFDDVLSAMDQPTLDGVNTYFVARAARAAGLKVALSGLGGDELFGGYGSFREVPRLVRTVGVVPGAARLGRGFRVVAAPVLRRFTSPKYAGLFEYGTSVGDAYLLRRGLFMPWELPDVLDADLAREGWAALEVRARLAATAAPLRTDALRLTALEAAWYMRHQLLRDTDWASMAHGLEVRVPLVDPVLYARVAPFVAAGAVRGKALLTAAARPALPAAVLNRPKTGFGVPVRAWLQEANGAAPAERGLRGWARLVYARALIAAPAVRPVTPRAAVEPVAVA